MRASANMLTTTLVVGVVCLASAARAAGSGHHAALSITASAWGQAGSVRSVPLPAGTTPQAQSQRLPPAPAGQGAVAPRRLPSPPTQMAAPTNTPTVARTPRLGPEPAPPSSGRADAFDPGANVASRLLAARRALAAGDVTMAGRLAAQGRAMAGADAALAAEAEQVFGLLRWHEELGRAATLANHDPARLRRNQADFFLTQAEGLARYAEYIEAARLAQNARRMGAAYLPTERNPDQVLGQILALQNAALARHVAPASHQQVMTTGGQPADARYPVQQGVYDPARDATRNMPATALQGPIQPGPIQPVAAPGDVGRRLINEGFAALQAQDLAKASELFQEAWKYQADLDPQSQKVLRDQLLALPPAATARRAPQALPEPQPLASPQEEARTQLNRLLVTELSEAGKIREANPRGALERLEKLRVTVNEAQLDPASKQTMLARVDRGLQETRDYIKANAGDIELREANQQARGAIEADRARRLEIQNILAGQVEKFNGLLDEGRYAEAEVIAKQALEIAPDEPVTQTMIIKARVARQVAQQMQIRERAEAGFVEALASVEESRIPFDDRHPIAFGDVTRWNQLSESRLRQLANRHSRLNGAEQEIENALKKPVQVRFEATPLREVLGYLGAVAGINIHLDPKGLSAEGVDADAPVTIRLQNDISLKSALNLILEPKHLGYVIQNEVLKVTSEQSRETDVYAQPYYVGDLVIPIPNFIPTYDLGLPGAIREAHNALGLGGVPTSGGGPLTVAGNAPKMAGDASVLAQMGAAGVTLPGGQRLPNRPNGFGPGGLGGGSGADFDSLIELITSTIAPQTWDEVGGPGSIQGFDTNLSLVVSQTQEVHEQIADLLEQLRRLQDLQVTIEVRFITVSDDFFERIGIDFDFDIDDRSGLTTAGLAARAIDDTHNPSVTVGLSPTGAPTADLDLSFGQGSFGVAVPQFGGFDPATAANFGFAILSDIEVFFLINAAQGNQRANVLEAPKVTLFNGQQAVVSRTTQRPFVTSVIPVVGDFAAAHQPVVVVLSEGSSLSVQAVVSNDRRFVRLTLVPFFSQIGDVQEFTFNFKKSVKTGTNTLINGLPRVDDAAEAIEGTTVQLPEFSFVTVTTTVSVPDGGTVLLGGIKSLSEGRVENGVPMLNKIPYVNRLFRNVGIGRETESLMMMVTPRIIIQEEEEEKVVGRPLN